MPDGGWGEFRRDDGESIPFNPASDDPRHIAAIELARRDGWAEIRPGHWATAGGVVRALKQRDMIRPKRERAR